MKQFYKTKVGKWLLLYLSSAILWWWDVNHLLVNADDGIGSQKSPIGINGSRAGGGISNNKEVVRTKASTQTVKPLNEFATFMWYVMGFTLAVGLITAFAGLAANTSKLSLAIQSGNASATQKHLKDHAQFYINTAIATGSLFILELIAYFVGMGGYLR